MSERHSVPSKMRLAIKITSLTFLESPPILGDDLEIAVANRLNINVFPCRGVQHQFLAPRQVIEMVRNQRRQALLFSCQPRNFLPLDPAERFRFGRSRSARRP